MPRLSGLTLITNSLNAAACFSEHPTGRDNQIIILTGEFNLLADHSKVGGASRETWCPADRISRLFCDSQAQQAEGFEALRAQVGQVVLV